MAWSILSPLMGLLIMWMVFNNFAKEVDYFRKISTGGQDGTDYLWRVSIVPYGARQIMNHSNARMLGVSIDKIIFKKQE